MPLDDEACRRLVAEIFEVPLDQVLPNVNQVMESVLKSFSDNHRKVIYLSYFLQAPGFHSEYLTYREVGARTKYESNNVGRILKKAIKKLRQPDLSEKFRPFIIGHLHADPGAPWKRKRKIIGRPQRRITRQISDIQRLLRELP